MKMVMIVYNEVMDSEMMDALKCCGLKSYTKTIGVFGSGKASGTHMGDDVWPGKNNILQVVCETEETEKLIPIIKDMRAKLGKEGVKAFVMPVEEVT